MTEVVLRESDTSAPPSTSAEAAVRLDTLRADPKWTSALLGGGSEQTKEFHDLHELAAKGDSIDMAMAGVLQPGIIQTSKHMQNIGAAEMLKGLGNAARCHQGNSERADSGAKGLLRQDRGLEQNAMSDRTWSNLLMEETARPVPSWQSRTLSSPAELRRARREVVFIRNRPCKSQD